MTGPDDMSLVKAIHELRPDLSDSQVKVAVRVAKQEEKRLQQESKQQRGTEEKKRTPGEGAEQRR